MIYFPYYDWGGEDSFFPMLAPAMTVLVRAEDDSATLVPAIRQIVRDLDSNLPIFAVTTLKDRIASTLRTERQAAALFGAFAVVGLMLAAIGLVGIVSYTVRQRTREIAVRMALGAGPYAVLSLIMKRVWGLMLAGTAAGALTALGFTRLLESQLYGVAPTDPAAFIASIVGLFVVGTGASLLQARRATRIDPLATLRSE